MDICFITHSQETPSTRYRIVQFIPHLEKEGFRVSVMHLSQNPISRLITIMKLHKYNVVIIQKKLFNSLWFSLIRKRSRRLIYEFDDCIYLKRGADRFHIHKTRFSRFQKHIQESDAVIASTKHLQIQAQKSTNDKWKVKIIPNCVDPDQYPVKKSNQRDEVVIGWIGSTSTVNSLLLVKDQLSQIVKLFKNVKIKIVSNRHIDLGIAGVENKLFSKDEEISDILSFDISISTYLDDPWNMGKAPVKILTSMACGIPVVAIDSTSARVYIKHHKNGLLAADPNDFMTQISLLIESPKLREVLSKGARETIEQLFNIKKVVKGYKAILEEASKN